MAGLGDGVGKAGRQVGYSVPGIRPSVPGIRSKFARNSIDLARLVAGAPGRENPQGLRNFLKQYQCLVLAVWRGGYVGCRETVFAHESMLFSTVLPSAHLVGWRLVEGVKEKCQDHHKANRVIGLDGMKGNVTIAPSELATAAKEMEIKEVLDLKSGAYYDARRFIERRRYDRLVKVRNVIREALTRKKPWLACSTCGHPVYLVAHTDKRFFFRHTIEDGTCPAVTKDRLTFEERKALKYQGARESEAHHRIKGLIERCLRADQRFSDVDTEKQWRSATDVKVRRQPDVSASFAGLRLAFEAQLSTTFLDVVVGRRIFYKDEGGLLVWVLPRFDSAYRRMTDDDILFTNNSNVLVVDAETAALSEACGKFMVRCHYVEPVLSGFGRAEAWKTAIVDFGELTLDLPNQRAYWFDFDRAISQLQQQLRDEIEAERQIEEERRRQREEERAATLRSDFFAFWERNANWHSVNEHEDEEWDDLKDRFFDLGIKVPMYHKSDRTFRPVVSALASMQAKRVIGSDHKKLVEVAHHIANQYKPFALLLGWAIKTYDVEALLDEQDGSRKWANRRRTMRARIAEGDPEYTPDHSWDSALRFLFPELAARIGG